MGFVSDLHGRPLRPLRGLVARVEALWGVGQPHAQPPLHVLQSLWAGGRKVVGDKVGRVGKGDCQPVCRSCPRQSGVFVQKQHASPAVKAESLAGPSSPMAAAVVPPHHHSTAHRWPSPWSPPCPYAPPHSTGPGAPSQQQRSRVHPTAPTAARIWHRQGAGVVVGGSGGRARKALIFAH